MGEDKDADDDQSVDIDLRYKDRTVGDALSTLEQTVENATTEEKKEEEEYKIANEWVEITAKQIVLDKSWSKISKTLLLHVLALPRLNIDEIDLFNAIIKW